MLLGSGVGGGRDERKRKIVLVVKGSACGRGYYLSALFGVMVLIC